MTFSISFSLNILYILFFLIDINQLYEENHKKKRRIKVERGSVESTWTAMNTAESGGGADGDWSSTVEAIGMQKREREIYRVLPPAVREGRKGIALRPWYFFFFYLLFINIFVEILCVFGLKWAQSKPNIQG